MKIIKASALIVMLAAIFSAPMYITKYNPMASAAAVCSSEEAQTEHDRQLCNRLIRFGQVAFDRGQAAEAKHFFQKAITVAPDNREAWSKYNMALLALVSAKVASDPGFLPELILDNGVSAPIPQSSTDTADDGDGC